MNAPCPHCAHYGAACTAHLPGGECARVTSAAYTTDQCRPCWLKVYGVPAPAVNPAVLARMALATQCVHRGEPTGREVGCGACGTQHQTAPVLACALHGECSEQPSKERSLKDCRTCPDRDAGGLPAEGAVVRHLCYHVWPVGGRLWRRNVEQLRKRIGLFNGRRVVAVATGGGAEPASAVRAELAGAGCEIVEVPNDPSLREVRTLRLLLGRVLTEDPAHVLFWGHAKGVTRPDNPGVTVHPWADLLYETCLDYWPLVYRTIKAHPLAGSFKKVGAGFEGSRSSWHYSGSWFWVRSRDLARKQWWGADEKWWGVESYPSLHFPAEGAGVLFHEGTVPALDLYKMEYLQGTVLPAYERWKAEHTSDYKEWP